MSNRRPLRKRMPYSSQELPLGNTAAPRYVLPPRSGSRRNNLPSPRIAAFSQ